jgi:hypothetical protein
MPLPVIPTNHHRNKNDRFPGVITTRVPFVNRSVQFAEIRDLGSGVCGHGMTRKITELGKGRSGGLRAGVLPRRTPRARRGQEEIVVGNRMVTTNVVIDFAVRRGWGNDDC